MSKIPSTIRLEEEDDNLLSQLASDSGNSKSAVMRNLFKLATTCLKSNCGNSGNININNIENINIYLNSHEAKIYEENIIDVDYK